MDLSEVVDTFTRGFAAWRSRTHPYLVERVGPLWLMRDAPRKDPAKERNHEYVALDTAPKRVAELIRKSKPKRYALCVVHDGEGRRPEVEAGYKAAGFRYALHEPIFVCGLPPAPRGRAPLPVRRVKKVEEARAVAKAARTRQIDEADIGNDDAAARLFAAFDDGAPVGWVGSLRTSSGAAWVSNLYVLPSHRGRGVGRALMRAMLRDDARRGIRHSVLTASSAGAKLYPGIGYKRVGTLQMFRPGR